MRLCQGAERGGLPAPVSVRQRCCLARGRSGMAQCLRISRFNDRMVDVGPHSSTDRATAFYNSGPCSGNAASVSSQIRGNLKGKEAIVKLPVAVGAKGDQVTKRIDLTDCASKWKRADGLDVANVNVLIIATYCTPLRSP